MKKKILLVLTIFCTVFCIAQNVPEEKVSYKSYENLTQQQAQIEKDLLHLNKEIKDNSVQLNTLQKENDKLNFVVDSLQKVQYELNEKQILDKNGINRKIEDLNTKILFNQSEVNNRTIFGVITAVIFVVILLFVWYYLSKRVKIEIGKIGKIQKAQDDLQLAQTKLQEECIKIDSKMIDLMEKFMKLQPPSSSEPDHSLALKVADEITRIEVNLSRMDASVRGYKQLSKAVERIKNNFLANGYEIVDMLGKPYNEGMKVIADFVPDEKLAEGEQIITGITKPQIKYKGDMIQAGQVTVSQNI